MFFVLANASTSCWRPLADEVQDVPLGFCGRGRVNTDNWVLYDRIDESSSHGEDVFPKQSSAFCASSAAGALRASAICVDDSLPGLNDQI
ncbi:hypothetical protein GQ44DRAFT_778274 [Phaeosphaeriaceae sp. PMI808]|nr:hypothetical protein GQ44DRAFT_778274 [Phaeosphaeriaceae sp. PMI808]